MAIIKILVKGYVKEKDGVEFASSTVTLIRENNLNIIVDPGMDRQALLNGLSHEGLSTSDIHFIILTHTHTDHALLAGIFEKAQVLDDDTIYSFDGKIEEYKGKVPNTDIEIISTPGHDPFHCSILVNTEEYGKVVIAGDVFWWIDSEEQNMAPESLLNHKDPYMKDGEALRKSRERVLDIADYIIPGHGEMFKVKNHGF